MEDRADVSTQLLEAFFFFRSETPVSMWTASQRRCLSEVRVSCDSTVFCLQSFNWLVIASTKVITPPLLLTATPSCLVGGP